MKKKMIKDKLFVTVKNTSGYGSIYLPKGLIGKRVEISFERELNEEELKSLEIVKLQEELRELRKKRWKNRKTIVKPKQVKLGYEGEELR